MRASHDQVSKFHALRTNGLYDFEDLAAILNSGLPLIPGTHGVIAFGNNTDGIVFPGVDDVNNNPTKAFHITLPTTPAFITTSNNNASGMAMIDTTGSLYTWGSLTASGPLGRPISGDSDIPTKVGTDTNWKTVSIANNAGVGVKTNGELWSWGQGTSYQTGQGVTTALTPPTQVGTATDWDNAWIFATFGIGTKTDGTLWSWGVNTSGQTAQGVTSGNTTTPTQVGVLTDWLGLKIKNTGRSIIGMKSSGAFTCWGDYAAYALGLGSTGSQTTPRQWIQAYLAVIDCCSIRGGLGLLYNGSDQYVVAGLPRYVGSGAGTVTSWTVDPAFTSAWPENPKDMGFISVSGITYLVMVGADDSLYAATDSTGLSWRGMINPDFANTTGELVKVGQIPPNSTVFFGNNQILIHY